MSYILDALRRADAERERGGVPGLHAQPRRGVADDAEPRRGLPWAAMVIGLLVLLIAVLAWMLLGRETPPEPMPAPAPAAVSMPMPIAPAPVVAAVPPPPIVAPAAPQAVPLPPPAPRPPVRTARAEAAPAKKAAAPAPAASAAPEARVPTLRELPDELRRQLPALAVGGSIYSESAASRFVIINGQLFHENDQLGPELTVRQIRLKSAILEFRGQRFELGY